MPYVSATVDEASKALRIEELFDLVKSRESTPASAHGFCIPRIKDADGRGTEVEHAVISESFGVFALLLAA